VKSGQGSGSSFARQQLSDGTPNCAGGNSLVQERGGGIFEVMSFVDDHPVEAWEDAVASGLRLDVEISQQQGMIQHQHLGASRLSTGLVVEA
jgi:hypothetical protein